MILKVGEHTMKVDINKLMKYPSQASKGLSAINLCNSEDIEAYIEEVIALNEEVNIEELEAKLLSSNEPILEL